MTMIRERGIHHLPVVRQGVLVGIIAPVDVLRFDDTVYRMLGSNLEALTTETELLLEPNTYGQRELRSSKLPGALVSEMSFTL